MSTSSTVKKNARRVDAAYWAEALNLFRKYPSNISAVARAMKADVKTIRELWHKGKPQYPWGERPMSHILHTEQLEAAARRQATYAEALRDDEHRIALAQRGAVDGTEAQRARLDAVNARAEEAKLIRAARVNAQALLQIISHVSKAALSLAQRLEGTITGDNKLTAGQAMIMLSRTGYLVQNGVYVTRAVIDTERQVLGDPAERLGNRAALEADQMSDEEAIEELSRAADVYARMKAAGFVVHAGGKAAREERIDDDADALALEDAKLVEAERAEQQQGGGAGQVPAAENNDEQGAAATPLVTAPRPADHDDDKER